MFKWSLVALELHGRRKLMLILWVCLLLVECGQTVCCQLLFFLFVCFCSQLSFSEHGMWNCSVWPHQLSPLEMSCTLEPNPCRCTKHSLFNMKCINIEIFAIPEDMHWIQHYISSGPHQYSRQVWSRFNEHLRYSRDVQRETDKILGFNLVEKIKCDTVGSNLIALSTLMQMSKARLNIRSEALDLVQWLAHWQVLQVLLVQRQCPCSWRHHINYGNVLWQVIIEGMEAHSSHHRISVLH